MANVNSEDIITSADTADHPIESGFNDYPGSVNRSYDEGDEDETLLEREVDGNETLVACLAPKDRWWGVYAIFYFLGITTLLPWNFFINADKYWMYKFRDVNATRNGTDVFSPDWDSSEAIVQLDLHPLHGKTPFQASFTSYLAIASNVPSTICFLLNAVISRWISANMRMVVSLIITLVIFIASTVLVQINTDSWQQGFFATTMISVIFMNSFCAFFQCGLLQVVGRFPPEYTTAVMSGQALGGIFAASANLLSIFFAADQVKSAFIYFLLGSASLFFSVCASVYLPRTLFFKFYTGGKSHQPYRFIENYPPQARIRPNETRKAKGMWIVFKKVWIQAISAMMVFVVTLAAFPTLMVLVVSEEVPSVWNEKYYVALVSFLVFSCGDYIGRILSGALQLPEKSSSWTLIFSILRIGFLPMIMMCQLHPRTLLPVIFKSDIEFGIISFLFGFSNGYLANVVFINAPQLVSREDQEEANGVVTTALGIGLSVGVSLSYFLLKLL
ncbi:equilibrative nucleoside transporter 3 [Folsomia candida]|nr:equilibrative nucleoside transporter 3 [Folsomia candida]